MTLSLKGPRRLVVYDLDGTLVDTRQDIVCTVRHMLASMRRPPLSDVVIASQVGRGLRHLVSRCLETDDPAHIEQGLAVYRAYYREHMLDHSRLYPDAQRTLEWFHPRPQAVLTNKSEGSSRALLAALGVDRYFGAVIGADTGVAFKPDPAGLHALLSRFNVAPSEAVLIGDSLVDLETGRNAGVPTVILRHGFGSDEDLTGASPDLLLADFAELLATAQRLGW